MRNASKIALACAVTLVLGVGLVIGSGPAAEEEFPLVFSGGHEIGKGDYGRPVVLIAAALEVKPDEFREAFSGVTPSRNGPPSGEEARRNKAALMKVLQPLGVTNDRLDEVSNYYRYRPQNGELWRTTPAKGHAVVENGSVTKIVLTEAGSGYSSLPQVTIKGLEGVKLRAVLHLDKELSKNGSIASIEMVGTQESAN
jgi:hypothetical protein